MLVEDIRLNATESIRIVELDPDVEEERSDRHLLAHKELLGPPHGGKALCRVGLGRGLSDQAVVRGIAPTSAVVSASGKEEIKEGVRVGVVPHPTRACDAEIERSEGIQVDLPLLTSELDGDTEHLAPHRLKLDGDPFVKLPLAIEISREGKAPPLGIARLGKKATRLRGILGQSLRCLIPGNARRDKAEGVGLARTGDLRGNAAAVESHREGLADTEIGEGSLGAVETKEISPEERGRMKVGAYLQGIQERGWSKSFVHDQVRQTGGIEVVGDIRLADRKHLDRAETDITRIPVEGVFCQTNRIVDSPTLQQEGPVADEIARLHPIIPILGDQIGAHGKERRKGAEIQEVGSGLTEGDP